MRDVGEPSPSPLPLVVLVTSSAWSQRTLTHGLDGRFAVATARDVAEALALVPEGVERVVVLLATSSPDLPAAVRRLCRARPLMALVLHGESPGDDVLVSALHDGCRGWLPDGAVPEVKARALAAVLRGELAFPRRLIAGLLAQQIPAQQRWHVQMTPRESDVLRMLGEARSTAAMAEALCISPVTVRTHVSAVLRKLGLRTRDEVVALLANDSS